MKKRKSTKKISKRQLKQRKQLYKNTIVSALMCLLILGISYVIFKTDILQPSVNEVTASYISFNNNDTTDIIKINNIKKMSDKIGKSIINKKTSNLVVSGENDSDYQLVIYPLINDIDLQYINYAIVIGDNTYTSDLASMPISGDEGIVIYNGKVTNEKELTIRMWVSKEYEGKVKSNSFKIKINPKQES